MGARYGSSALPRAAFSLVTSGRCIDITDLKQNHNRMLAAQKLESLGSDGGGRRTRFRQLPRHHFW